MPTRRSALQLAATLGGAAWMRPTLAAKPQPQNATSPLHAFFERYWQALLNENPEWASYFGDQRHADRLTDASAAGIARRDAMARHFLAEARAMPRAGLSPQDRISLDIFIGSLQTEVAYQAFDAYRTRTLGSSGGFQSSFAGVLQSMPMERRADGEAVLARLAAWPVRVDQELLRLRAGLAQGWASPKPVLDRVLQQIDAQTQVELDASPWLEPFTRTETGIAAADRDALRQRARTLVTQQVLPAMQRLRAFAADEALPAAPADGAMSRYPNGAQVYALVVREQTTTALTPQQIHALGLQHTTRLHAEMETLKTQSGFAGSFTEFNAFLNSDPKFFVDNGDDLLAGYRDIAKRIDPQLARLFAVLPRAPYGVRAMPDHLGPDAAEYYDSGTADGTRPGWFNANVLGYKTRPSWGMATLVAHESVPGHHLQGSRALELTELPSFRRNGEFTAYIEGWAVYAETLGDRIGLYTDPYVRYGHVQSIAFRAARLAVDTGIHAMGWSRQQAIDYMVDNTGIDPAFSASEVDRYYSDPGQALGYMIGLLKITELRERAQQRMGDAFDIRHFHNCVLDQGALPLTVLEQVVDEWIAAGGRA